MLRSRLHVIVLSIALAIYWHMSLRRIPKERQICSTLASDESTLFNRIRPLSPIPPNKSLDTMTRLSSEIPIPSSVGPLILPVVLTTLQQRLLVLSPVKLPTPRHSVLYPTILQVRRLQRVSLQIRQCHPTSSVTRDIAVLVPRRSQAHNDHGNKYRWHPLPRRLRSQ